MEFSYIEDEIEYLKRRDKKLGVAIETIGPLSGWNVEPNVFAAIVYNIAGQQISSAVHRKLCARILAGLGSVTPENILAVGQDGMRSFGLSARKAEYIYGVARAVIEGNFVPEELWNLDDAEVVSRLCALRGVGMWTAEMMLIFTLERRDVLSFGDFGIRRGLRMLYRHKEITPELFERYRRRYSPCCSLASLYLWEIAGGALKGVIDPASSKKAAR